MQKGCYVYIATNGSKTLYIGVTNNLERRIDQHKRKIGSEFAVKYNITRLVYYEHFADIRDAIAREKQLKKWRREKKVWLIERENPEWEDMSEEWFDYPSFEQYVGRHSERACQRTRRGGS